MINLNLKTTILSFVSLMVVFLLWFLLPPLRAIPNFLYVPLAFTAMVALLSRAGKIPIQDYGDVNAIVLVFGFILAGFFSLAAILDLITGTESESLVYWLILFGIYIFITHISLTVVFGLHKVKK